MAAFPASVTRSPEFERASASSLASTVFVLVMEFIPPKSASAKTICDDEGMNESVSSPDSPIKVALDESKAALEENVRRAIGKIRIQLYSTSKIGFSQANL